MRYPALMQDLPGTDGCTINSYTVFFTNFGRSFYKYDPFSNIAFNKDLEKDQEKLDLALDVLDCMISEEGQKLIADGSGVISLNTDVPSMMEDVLDGR